MVSMDRLPWRAGGLLVVDASYNIVAGLLTAGPDDPRRNQTIRQTAAAIIQLPRLLEAVRLLAQAAPLVSERLRRNHLAPHQEFTQAATIAAEVLAALGERS
jgi:hypothetical protein